MRIRLFHHLPLLASFCAAIVPLPARETMLYPALLPPDSAAIVSAPDAGAAWAAIARTPLAPLLERAAGTAGLGFLKIASPSGDAPASSTAAVKPFFGGLVDSAELAVIPPEGTASEGFLWIGATRDLAGTRDFFQRAERELIARAAGPSQTITRSNEAIGGASLVLLTDPDGALGWFLSGRHEICAVSNRPELLRRAARALESRGPRSSDAPTSFTGALRAWDRLNEITPAARRAHHIRIFLPRRDGGAAGWVRLEANTPRLETFTLFPSGGGSPLQGAAASGTGACPAPASGAAPRDNNQVFMTNASLWRAAPSSAPLPGGEFATPGALLFCGGFQFDPDTLRRLIAGFAARWSAGLPAPGAEAIAPASAGAQSTLATLRSWADDPDFLAELGPGWFAIVNRFDFDAPGQFPRIGLIAGVRTSRPELTADRAGRFGKEILNAAVSHPAAREDPAHPSRLEQTPGGSANAAIHTLRLSGAADAFQPSWTIARGYLLVALTPDTLRSALAAAPGGADPAPEAARARLGMGTLHAFQFLRPAPAASIVTALVSAMTGPAALNAPASRSRFRLLGAALECIPTAALFQRGAADGVLTTAEISLAFPTPPKENPSGGK